MGTPIITSQNHNNFLLNFKKHGGLTESMLHLSKTFKCSMITTDWSGAVIGTVHEGFGRGLDVLCVLGILELLQRREWEKPKLNSPSDPAFCQILPL